MNRPIRILALQPYFGGSHLQFHEGWVRNSELEWTTLTLPPRHWKWRMRHAGIYFTNQIRQLIAEGQTWDLVLCTDMMNVAEFRGLVDESVRRLPIVVYFHENQYAYPIRSKYIRDQHFPFTNFISAVAADRIWFNSQFNFDSMIEGVRVQAKQWRDHSPLEEIATFPGKASVQPPGIEEPAVDVDGAIKARALRARQDKPLRIVWAARWEYDKNPDDFFEALQQLDRTGVSFELNVIGQSYETVPVAFEQLKSRFHDRICRWGFQDSRDEYWQAFADADVFVSTAIHEFFGLSAAEAIASGLNVLLPDRLAYPELLGAATDGTTLQSCLYDGTPKGLCSAIQGIARRRGVGEWQIDPSVAQNMIDSIGWKQRAREMDSAFGEIVTSDFGS